MSSTTAVAVPAAPRSSQSVSVSTETDGDQILRFHQVMYLRRTGKRYEIPGPSPWVQFPRYEVERPRSRKSAVTHIRYRSRDAIEGQ